MGRGRARKIGVLELAGPGECSMSQGLEEGQTGHVTWLWKGASEEWSQWELALGTWARPCRPRTFGTGAARSDLHTHLCKYKNRVRGARVVGTTRSLLAMLRTWRGLTRLIFLAQPAFQLF
jgi:hypothetical protein